MKRAKAQQRDSPLFLQPLMKTTTSEEAFARPPPEVPALGFAERRCSFWARWDALPGATGGAPRIARVPLCCLRSVGRERRPVASGEITPSGSTRISAPLRKVPSKPETVQVKARLCGGGKGTRLFATRLRAQIKRGLLPDRCASHSGWSGSACSLLNVGFIFISFYIMVPSPPPYFIYCSSSVAGRFWHCNFFLKLKVV